MNGSAIMNISLSEFMDICLLTNTTQNPGDHVFESVLLNRDVSIGLALTAQAGCFSIVADLVVVGFLVRFFYLFSRRRAGTTSEMSVQDVNTSTSLFVLSLFLSDLVQSVGQAMDLWWVVQWEVREGSVCTAQGIIQQLGELGAALATTVLALYTFWLCVGLPKREGVTFKTWLRWEQQKPLTTLTTCIIVGVSWLFVLLWVIIGPIVNRDYEAPTPYWCWISGGYTRQRTGGEYAWFWLALTVSAVVYSSLGYFLRNVPDALNAVAFLAYPIIYMLVIIPSTVNRYLDTNDPASFAFFSSYTFALAGFLNAILYLVTRKEVFRLPGQIVVPPIAMGPLPNGQSNDQMDGIGCEPEEEDWPVLPT